MKKIIFICASILFLTVPVWAGSPQNNGSEANAIAIGVGVGIGGNSTAIGGNAIIEKGAVKIENNPTFIGIDYNSFNPTNKIRIDNNPTQSVNNGQTISPIQETKIEIENPKQFLSTPGSEVNPIPQLTYGNVKMIDVHTIDARVKVLTKGDIILSVKSTKTTKIQCLYETIIKGIQKLNGEGNNLWNIRIVVWSKNSVRMWSTGGQISGGGSGILGTTGIAGVLGIFPTFGRMTADDLFIVQFVQVVGK